MEWFTGNVTEALNAYQEKNGILIVYIHHTAEENNDNTKKFNELWDSFDDSILEGIPKVSIRMTNESEDAKQFSQFFPTPVFPVCYVIGLNGQPLEVITPVEPLTMTRLSNSIRKSLDHYRDQIKEQSGSAILSQSVMTNANSDSTVADDGSTTEDAQVSFDERVRYAREKLEEKRIALAAQKEEEQRKKELERRNDGKLMLDARERQKERELKEAIEKRKREKDEDAQRLKQLREQIKKDKEERARKAAGKPADEEKPEPEAIKPEPVINKPVDVDECRIQCRFPDGKTLVNVFPSKGPLQAVVDAVKKDGRQQGEFFLVQCYPRRQLFDLDKSLYELGLTPSSSLLIVPKEGQVLLKSGTKASYFQLLFGFLYIFYAPFAAIFKYFGIGGRAITNEVSNPNQQQAASDNANGNGERRIGRLRDNDDSSDNEATWNGNSTQQL